jgi:hypothetical protein
MNPLLALIGLGLAELAIILMVAGLGLVFWIWMIVDCITHETDAGNKIAWLLVILLVGLIGAPLYFFVRKLSRPAASPRYPGHRPIHT